MGNMYSTLGPSWAQGRGHWYLYTVVLAAPLSQASGALLENHPQWVECVATPAACNGELAVKSNFVSGTIPSTIGLLTGLTKLYVFRASRILRHTASSCFPLTTHIYIHISRTFTAGGWATGSAGRSQPRLVPSPGWKSCTSFFERAASFVTRHPAYHSPHVYICLSHFHGRDLNNNRISGTIPTEIRNLTGLQSMYVFRASRILRHTSSRFPLTSHIYI